MADRISQIKGMPSEAQRKLEAFEIRTTDDLLQKAATPPMRTHLAREIGVTPSEMTEWVNRADLMRLKGVGKEMANLLEEAGVDSSKELKHRKADHLYERLHEINAEKHITHHAPSLAQVQEWIVEAETFPA